ncbi:MAG: hypothetical protein DWQ47_06565 [Acidobacteria bacterium]|nr:MAG: hypothetical protein DWQ32_10115 [Acidobacteriota bacterium]REK02036.1 MAG: hypothetical protein DWQ38_06545 [Acidobacteriota bacterium]REK14994.1 MAG: hypothetical protein DWQ43_15805 [Acidobacteriota bacterium]REK45708.1 MAG: hypothetical protein DWQ47_06565 [Acidobacteriota bacterium]
MNYVELLHDILKVYEKHGWEVSRVLLSEDALLSLKGSDIAKGLEIVDSKVDAVWLERQSRNRKRAIELRWLNANPYALFELVDEDVSERELEKIRSRIELKLADHASGKGNVSDS